MGNAAICGQCGESRKKKIIKNEQKPEEKEETKLKQVPIEKADKLKKSICKIIFRKKNEELIYVTGFFMKISDILKYLIINYPIINQEIKDENIEIEIWNKEKMNINLKERSIRYFEKTKELTGIQIKEDDKLYSNIEFLCFDSNYKKGNLLYKYKDVFTIQHPYRNDSSCFFGIILNINNKEFEHNIPTENDSLGCPIILSNNNIDFLQVIGIHKTSDDKNKINKGIFINEIINELRKEDSNIKSTINTKVESKIDIVEHPKEIIKEISLKNEGKINLIEVQKEDSNNINNINYNKTEEIVSPKIPKEDVNINTNTNINNNNTNNNIINNNINNNKEININLNKPKGNFIIAEIFIKEEDINKPIRIINSYEEYIKNNSNNIDIKNLSEELKNEKEIKECEIRINDELIPFNYFYDFKHSKKYIIKYTFKSLLTKANYLFYNCSSLINIDLSNFDAKNVTDMSYMFYQCSSLINIDASYLNSNNVKNMCYMFCNCSSLINIDLTYFNTQNVKNMCCMFSGCSSLADINLSFLNTQNVEIMNHMFSFCSSLTELDLSNFIIKNVKSMCYMLYSCSSLESINLSSFNSEKIEKLYHFCSQKNFSCVLKKCDELKGNIITNDNKVKELLN